MSDVEETFPVHPCDRDLMGSVPWEWIAKHRRRVERNHAQTLEKLAERGGLSLREMQCAVAGERPFERKDSKREDHAAICGDIASWRAMRSAFAKAKEAATHKRTTPMSDKTLSAKEARVEIARLRQGVPLNPGVRKALANTLEVYVEQMATPKPDLSPVCVEVRELIWVNHRIDATFAATAFGAKYSVRESVTHPGRYRAYFAGDMLFHNVASPELAKNLCQADFERRTLELVNARSVESVRAEYLAELVELAEAEHEKAHKDMDGNRMVVSGAVYRFLCSLTEGEG